MQNSSPSSQNKAKNSHPASIKNTPKQTKRSKKRLLVMFLILVVIGWVSFMFYKLNVTSFFSEQINVYKEPTQTGANSEIQKLHTEIRDLEQQFKLLKNESKQNQHNQQRQLRTFTKQLAQFTTQINRWKTQLSSSTSLLEIIKSQLKLIQAQALVNYSPFLLAQQLSVIKQMLDDLRIEELIHARLDLNRLIQKLDLKPAPPIEFWLGELQRSYRSASLWVQQQQDLLPSNTAKEIHTSAPSQSTNENFFAKLKKHLNERLSRSLSISKPNPINNTSTQLTPIVNQSYNPQALQKKFQDRIENLRLSLLSHSWDQVRIQSLDLYQWIAENLPHIDTDLKQTLTQMSQYKPEGIPTSLVKIIQLIEDYQHQSYTSSTTITNIIEGNTTTKQKTTSLPQAIIVSTPRTFTPTNVRSTTTAPALSTIKERKSSDSLPVIEQR